jgi:hypothetical protein
MSETLPTLPIGAVLHRGGWDDREVILSYPGLCLAVTPARQIWAMGYLEGAWRSRRTGDPYTVRPEPIEFQAHQRDQFSWMVQSTYSDRSVVLLDPRALPDHMDPHAVAMAIADLLNGMTNEVQP